MDLSGYLVELLYEQDTVILPGFGGFVASYQPASVDQVQGLVHPPTKSIQFNENLVLDDGLLVRAVQEKNNLSTAEAERLVEAYVQNLLAALDRREIVVFPRLGRIYRDYEQRLQFLPESTNFNLDSFGLPSIKAFPLAQSNRRTAAEPLPASGTAATKVRAASPSINIRRQLPLIGAALGVILLFLIGLYLLDRQGNTAEEKKELAGREIPSSRINTKPSLPPEEEPAGESSAAGEEGPAKPSTPSVPPALPQRDPVKPDGTITDSDIDTEASTPAPGQRFAVIAIGIFGNRANVDKLVKEIYQAGYEPYTEPVGNLTRVGVQLPYERSSDIEKALEDIRNRFNSDAVILRKGKTK